eukprot:m.250153 g.250153  ORF g.250153 m.250153 type:complete len:64 (+) comp76484_c0_seq1:198-389(+)
MPPHARLDQLVWFLCAFLRVLCLWLYGCVCDYVCLSVCVCAIICLYLVSVHFSTPPFFSFSLL